MSIVGNKFTKEINIDISSYSLLVITAQQGDKLSRYVKINVFADGEPITFSSDISATLEGHRSDGQVICDKCVIQNNSIIIELTDAMLATYGDGEYKIVFYGTDGSALSSAPFKVHVMKNPYDETAVIATPTFSALIDALNKVNKAIKDTEKVIHDSTEKINEMNRLEADLTEIKNNLIQAENERVEAEQKREQKVDEAITKVENSLVDINNTIDEANSAIGRVDEIAKMYENYNKYFVLKTEIGVPNGVPSLDENGKIPPEQLQDIYEKEWFLGTTKELEEALNNGQLKDGTKVFITDDF